MSKEIAGLLSWERSDIETMLTNAPKPVAAFKDYAQRIMQSPDSTEQRIQEIKTFIKLI